MNILQNTIQQYQMSDMTSFTNDPDCHMIDLVIRPLSWWWKKIFLRKQEYAKTWSVMLQWSGVF